VKLAVRFPLILLFPRHYTPSFLCASESFFLALRRLLSWCFPFQLCGEFACFLAEVCRSICPGCGFWRSFIDARTPARPPLLQVCAGLSVYSEKNLVWSWFVCDRRSPSFDVCSKHPFAGDFLVLKRASVNPVALCLSKWTLLSKVLLGSSR
jgi:hypothetical protein